MLPFLNIRPTLPPRASITHCGHGRKSDEKVIGNINNSGDIENVGSSIMPSPTPEHERFSTRSGALMLLWGTSFLLL